MFTSSRNTQGLGESARMRLRQHRRDAVHGQHPREEAGQPEEEAHDPRRHGRLGQEPRQVPPPELAVVEERHGEAVEDRHRGRLGGGEDPAEDAAAG